jgi:carboxymethylenebutenolidase
VRTSTVDVPTPDGVADAYLARPDGTGPHPGVLFIMDAIGLRPRIQEMAERVASAGYVVLAPNVFYRSGRAPVLPLIDLSEPDNRTSFMQAVRPLMEQLTPDLAARDGAAYLDYLTGMAPGPVAITGYCMGGRLGWQIAATQPDRVAALGCFHAGRLVTDAPDSPHQSAAALKAELYFGHADQDQSMTPNQIATLEPALDAASVRYRSELYEGAQHGYTMADTAAYDEVACERHFTELFALLERALGAH